MFKLLWQFMDKKDKLWMLFIIFLSLLQVICDIAQPFLLSNLATELVSSFYGHDVRVVWKYAGIMIALAILSLGLGTFVVFISARTSVRVCGNIRFGLYNKIQGLTDPEIDKLSPASLITRITNDVTFLQNAIILVLRTLLRSIFLFIGGIIASFVYSSRLSANDTYGNENLWWLAFVVLGCLFVLFLIMVTIIPFSIPYFKKQQKQTDKTNAVMRENILGIKVVKAYNLQSEQFGVFDVQNKELKRVSTIGQRISFTVMPMIQFFVQVSIVALLMVAAVFMQGSASSTDENSSAGFVISFIQMVSLIVMGMILSSMSIVQIAQSKASTTRIWEVLNTKRSIPKNESKNMIEDSRVSFKNVSFKYANNPGALNVLENINFDAKPGEMIGIIGPTGSGKSTLVSLITRQYDVQEGEIMISGFNVKDINHNSLRHSIGVVPQKSFLFSGTIRSNIQFGKNDATDQELIEAAKKAEALEFIKNKENGFDSTVDQRGGNFSGGQKQRLSIARALVRKPKILILDDSTSALDMITEAKVQQNVRSFKDSTIFLIGQRIAAISRADKIIVLEQGKMVGYGNHEQLMKTCALYKEIADSQSLEQGGR